MAPATQLCSTNRTMSRVGRIDAYIKGACEHLNSLTEDVCMTPNQGQRERPPCNVIVRRRHSGVRVRRRLIDDPAEKAGALHSICGKTATVSTSGTRFRTTPLPNHLISIPILNRRLLYATATSDFTPTPADMREQGLQRLKAIEADILEVERDITHFQSAYQTTADCVKLMMDRDVRGLVGRRC